MYKNPQTQPLSDSKLYKNCKKVKIIDYNYDDDVWNHTVMYESIHNLCLPPSQKAVHWNYFQ